MSTTRICQQIPLEVVMLWYTLPLETKVRAVYSIYRSLGRRGTVETVNERDDTSMSKSAYMPILGLEDMTRLCNGCAGYQTVETAHSLFFFLAERILPEFPSSRRLVRLLTINEC